MEKIYTWIRNVVDWIDCFNVRVWRWYLKLKMIFRVLMFVLIVIYTLVITVATMMLIFIYDVIGLLVSAVLNIGDHIHRAKIMNQYEDQEIKMMREASNSES